MGQKINISFQKGLFMYPAIAGIVLGIVTYCILNVSLTQTVFKEFNLIFIAHFFGTYNCLWGRLDFSYTYHKY